MTYDFNNALSIINNFKMPPCQLVFASNGTKLQKY